MSGVIVLCTTPSIRTNFFLQNVTALAVLCRCFGLARCNAMHSIATLFPATLQTAGAVAPYTTARPEQAVHRAPSLVIGMHSEIIAVEL